MSTLPIASISSNGDSPRDSAGLDRKLPTDSKIRDVIVSRITLHAVKEGTLLANATAPRLVIPAASFGKRWDELKRNRRKKQSALPSRWTAPVKYYPIGLEACETHDWVNALMQLLMFVPALRELFAYTPYSFRPFNDFIDRYFFDMQEGRLVSFADSRELAHCLLAKFPFLFAKNCPINLHRVVHEIHAAAIALPEEEAALVRPEWQLLWDPREKFIPNFSDRSEWLLGATSSEAHRGHSLQKQYLILDQESSFEMDAFIEHRAEESGEGTYYAYLKIEEGWVQCANERVFLLSRGTSIDIPLRRGILFHYRRNLLRKAETLRG